MAHDDSTVLAELVSTSETSEATRIIIAYISNPNTRLEPTQLSQVILDVYAAIEKRGAAEEEVAPAPRPAVPVDQSVGPDYLICLEDGVKLKMLKRYLNSQHQMTPEEYRAKWNLPRDYPMVAPSYSSRRSELAKEQGLGRKPAPPAKRSRGRQARRAS